MRFLGFANLFILATYANEKATAVGNKVCKCFPGDTCWPLEREWEKFNTTVGGRLVQTVPLGSPCHYPHYDATLCEELRSEWLLPPVQ